jgi:hypothetical protein
LIDLWDENSKKINYCTFADLLSGKIPENTWLNIDEADQVIFNRSI